MIVFTAILVNKDDYKYRFPICTSTTVIINIQTEANGVVPPDEIWLSASMGRMDAPLPNCIDSWYKPGQVAQHQRLAASPPVSIYRSRDVL